MYRIKLPGKEFTLACKPSIVGGVLFLYTPEGKPKLIATYAPGQWLSIEAVAS